MSICSGLELAEGHAGVLGQQCRALHVHALRSRPSGRLPGAGSPPDAVDETRRLRLDRQAELAAGHRRIGSGHAVAAAIASRKYSGLRARRGRRRSCPSAGTCYPKLRAPFRAGSEEPRLRPRLAAVRRRSDRRPPPPRPSQRVPRTACRSRQSRLSMRARPRLVIASQQRERRCQLTRKMVHAHVRAVDPDLLRRPLPARSSGSALSAARARLPATPASPASGSEAQESRFVSSSAGSMLGGASQETRRAARRVPMAWAR